MARKKFREIESRFVQVPWGFVGGNVWKLLSHPERTLYMELRATWQSQTRGDFSKPFTAPYESLSAAPGTISRALKKFQRFGIIKIAPEDRGGLGLWKGATLYRLLKTDWRAYVCTEEEKRRLDCIQREKKSRWKKNQTRREQRQQDYLKKVSGDE